MLEVRQDDLSDGNVIALLQEHRREMFKHSPAESVHALDQDGLRAPNITFWSAWLDGKFAGCGALKQLDPQHAEIKSMKTAAEHVRKGVAAAILDRVLQVAATRGYKRVSLETGTMDAFIPARKLYEKVGFIECPPFADYFVDPNSVCMTKTL